LRCYSRTNAGWRAHAIAVESCTPIPAPQFGWNRVSPLFDADSGSADQRCSAVHGGAGRATAEQANVAGFERGPTLPV